MRARLMVFCPARQLKNKRQLYKELVFPIPSRIGRNGQSEDQISYIAPLFAEAIERVYEEVSISTLFR